ncbi:MAG: hypothetical protein IJH34_12805 [Romboutsia sp.]|nr:hypothetical protein [Romboutsia sp.]
MKDLRIKYVMETSYEDSTYWVGYSINNLHSIALVEADNNLEAINETVAIYDTVADKKSLEVCSDLLRGLILECSASDNDMLYVDEDEITDKEVKQLQEEISNLGLGGYVEFYNNDTSVTFYGGIITEFSF